MQTPLEKTFNLESLEKIKKAVEILDEIKEEKPNEEISEEELKEIIEKKTLSDSLVDKVPDDDFDRDMEDVAESAGEKAERLFDISINEVDTRAMGEVASAAERFLRIKLDAKVAKNQRKLDLFTLSLREREVILRERKFEREIAMEKAEIIESDDDGYHDRNKLLDNV